MLHWQLLLPVPLVSTHPHANSVRARGFSSDLAPAWKNAIPSLFKCLMALLLSLILEAAIPDAWAGPGFQPVSSDELKMTSEPQAPGAAAILLYRQVDRDDNGRTTHEDSYFRIKILTEEGRKYADIEIPFLKQSENINNVRARTIKPDGSIVNFDGKVFFWPPVPFVRLHR